jgi:hypothetical protein
MLFVFSSNRGELDSVEPKRAWARVANHNPKLVHELPWAHAQFTFDVVKGLLDVGGERCIPQDIAC